MESSRPMLRPSAPPVAATSNSALSSMIPSRMPASRRFSRRALGQLALDRLQELGADVAELVGHGPPPGLPAEDGRPAGRLCFGVLAGHHGHSVLPAFGERPSADGAFGDAGVVGGVGGATLGVQPLGLLACLWSVHAGMVARSERVFDTMVCDQEPRLRRRPCLVRLTGFPATPILSDPGM